MIATTAYLELFLRKIADPRLVCVFLKLVCIERFDDQQILTNLVSRISGSSKVQPFLCPNLPFDFPNDFLMSFLRLTMQLSLVTLTLFETMIDICCEDVMFELIFK